MSYSKVIPIGSVGSLTISEAAGVASIAVAMSEVSGGSLEGAAKATLSLSAEISGQSLIDAGLALAEAKFPSAAPVLAALKAIIDAELVNL